MAVGNAAVEARAHAGEISDCESFHSVEANYDAEEQRQIEAGITVSLADAPTAESPPIVHAGANRAESYHTPPSGRSAPVKKGKTRGGRSMKPLQTANRG